MGKYSDCLSQTPLARPEYAIYTPKIDCKTVCIFGCKSHNGPPLALGRHQVRQKVWSEAENEELDWGETLKIRTFFLSPHTPFASLCACETLTLLLRNPKPILRKKNTLLYVILPQGVLLLLSLAITRLCRELGGGVKGD